MALLASFEPAEPLFWRTRAFGSTRSARRLGRLELLFDCLEALVFSQLFQVRVLQQPLEVIIALIDGSAKDRDCKLELAGQGIAAGKVIKDRCIVWPKLRELLVDLKAVFEFAAAGIVVAPKLERFDGLGGAGDDSFNEADFYVEVLLLLSAQ